MKITFLLFLVNVSVMKAQLQPVTSKVYRWNELQIEKLETRERRHVLEGIATDLEYLEIHTSTLEPGKSPHASHTHDDVEEMIIVKEGKLKVTIKDKTKILGPGSVALAIPGEEHGFENGGDTRTTYYIIKYRSKAPMDIERGKQAGGSFMIDWNDVAIKTTEKGGRRQFFDRATAMFKRIEMHVTTLNQGLDSHAPHTHRAEEIILLLRGDTRMFIDGKHHDASVGDLTFLGSQVPHALSNMGDGQCEYFAFQWE